MRLHVQLAPHARSILFPPKNHLKRVVFWRDLLDKVIAENRHLLHNVLAHARYLSEEEEGEEAGHAAEGAEGYAAVQSRVSAIGLHKQLRPPYMP